MYYFVTIFLNGVCRHEQYIALPLGMLNFLNGVCRHELSEEANN
ncbi:hypothetical protein URS_2234 [Acinetobacter ursingii]|nr:hypothetical protein URS_2234 [Acinetobacter ursingii]